MGESKSSFEETTSVKLDIVGNHHHDLPVIYIVVVKPAANPGYVSVVLHFFELAAEKPCTRRIIRGYRHYYKALMARGIWGYIGIEMARRSVS